VQAVEGGSLRHAMDVFVLVPVRLYRDGIADAVARDARFRTVGTAASLAEAREQLVRLERPPDVALIDLGVAERAADVHELNAECPSTRIVALAVRDAEEDIVSWADLGVAGRVSRDATIAELLDALEAAARDEALVSPATAGTLLRRVAALARSQGADGGPALTRREREGSAERKRLGSALGSAELDAAIRQDPELKADVDATRAALEEEEARAKERTAALKQAQAEWTKEMASLRELL
jgi:two-component system, NarL family, nitrate/nitrite response regulator NarL